MPNRRAVLKDLKRVFQQDMLLGQGFGENLECYHDHREDEALDNATQRNAITGKGLEEMTIPQTFSPRCSHLPALRPLEHGSEHEHSPEGGSRRQISIPIRWLRPGLDVPLPFLTITQTHSMATQRMKPAMAIFRSG